MVPLGADYFDSTARTAMTSKFIPQMKGVCRSVIADWLDGTDLMFNVPRYNR
jgi:hypothetical protein